MDFIQGAIEGTIESIGLICFLIASVAVFRGVLYLLFEKKDYLVEYLSTRNSIGRKHAQLRMLQRQKNRINKKCLKIQRELRTLEDQLY
jgi:CHASE3 domain sensor protein